MSSEPDDIVRAIIHQITGNPHGPNIEPGQLLANLDATQATQFAHIASDLTNNRYLIVTDDDNALRLQTVEQKSNNQRERTTRT